MLKLVCSLVPHLDQFYRGQRNAAKYIRGSMHIITKADNGSSNGRLDW